MTCTAAKASRSTPLTPNLYNLAETIEPDSWDAWNADRDQELTSQEATRTAASGSAPNSNNPAWSDLDANGNWYNVPGQGYVWSPNEAASGDWDPYGCGNWVWTPQFGYVWVSCEQWGYLPYTSGDWNYYDGFGWGWAPGYGISMVEQRWVGLEHWQQTGLAISHRTVPTAVPFIRPTSRSRRGGFYQPNPVIAVNRIPGSPSANPVHVVGRPVTIGGTHHSAAQTTCRRGQSTTRRCFGLQRFQSGLWKQWPSRIRQFLPAR